MAKFDDAMFLRIPSSDYEEVLRIARAQQKSVSQTVRDFIKLGVESRKQLVSVGSTDSKS